MHFNIAFGATERADAGAWRAALRRRRAVAPAAMADCFLAPSGAAGPPYLSPCSSSASSSPSPSMTSSALPMASANSSRVASGA